MIEIRRILCPTDFSDASKRAMERAIVLAKWYEAELTVLHVLSLAPSTTGFPPAVSPFTLALVPRERFLEDLRRFSASAVEAGVRTEVVLGEGSAAGEILDAARKIPADLIVMGTHGRGGFERLVLGSVAEKVLRRACCPVVTVPASAEPLGSSPSPPFGSILCACDFSAASRRALDYALSLAQEAKSVLTVLHVVEWSPEQDVREHRHLDAGGYRRYLEDEARGLLEAAIPDEARLWCDIHTVVGMGRVPGEIERVARERKADLIVMGIEGRGPVDMMLFGSTTRHVIRESGLPVLTVGTRRALPAAATDRSEATETARSGAASRP
jgi:nucleotide-binding universal stress UspA family protein